MKNNLIKKVFSVLLVAVIFLMQFPTYSVKAVSIEEINYVINEEDVEITEEKIMKYDAKTNTTTEVNMEEIIELLTQKRTTRSNCAEAYDPFLSTSNISANVSLLAYDNFTRVTNLNAFANRVTCRLMWDAEPGYVGAGTGFLVGPNLLLTAAHCVFSSGSNTKTGWTAYPAFNDGPYIVNGTSYYTGWKEIYYSSNWTNFGWNDYDWCLCVLEEDLGTTFGYYGIQAYGTNSELNGVSVRALGYPIDINGALYQYYTSGSTSNTHARYFHTSAQTLEGMSGGPIYRTSDNCAVGIIKGGIENTTSTYGVRITQNIIDLVRSLR